MKLDRNLIRSTLVIQMDGVNQSQKVAVPNAEEILGKGAQLLFAPDGLSLLSAEADQFGLREEVKFTPDRIFIGSGTPANIPPLLAKLEGFLEKREFSEASKVVLIAEYEWLGLPARAEDWLTKQFIRADLPNIAEIHCNQLAFFVPSSQSDGLCEVGFEPRAERADALFGHVKKVLDTNRKQLDEAASALISFAAEEAPLLAESFLFSTSS